MNMDDPEQKPLLVAEFEERVLKTDEMEEAPDTAFLGLFGEIGSLVSALKKRRRDKGAYLGYERAVLEEVGDVLWYASAFARRGGTSLAEAASRSIGDRTPANQVTLGQIAPAPAQPVSDAATEAALLDLAGEAGDIAHTFKNGAYKDNTDLVRGDLIKLTPARSGFGSIRGLSRCRWSSQHREDCEPLESGRGLAAVVRRMAGYRRAVATLLEDRDLSEARQRQGLRVPEVQRHPDRRPAYRQP
jgi:NTP pyrophosphatase (non-canonical NTP hydrolase)